MYYLTDDDYKKAWDKNRITRTTLRARVYNYKWSLEKAINTPIQKKESIYLKKAKENGILPQTYYTRIWRGWSKEQACSIPPMWVKKSNENIIKENRVKRKYDTLNNCPYDYNLIYDESVCISTGKCKDCWKSVKEV